MPRTSKTCAVLILAAMLAMTLSGCRRTPDEVQVRAAIAAVAHGAETGAASEMAAPLSDDFDGNAGELDRQQLIRMVQLLVLRGEHIGVTMGPIMIESRGERMLATLTVTLSSGSHLLPDQLGVYRVESAWRKEGGNWRCYSATWKQSI